MKNFSTTTTGLIAAFVGPIVAQQGFSEACSGEVTSWLVPTLAALPGLIAAQFGRWNAGGITWYGKRV